VTRKLVFSKPSGAPNGAVLPRHRVIKTGIDSTVGIGARTDIYEPVNIYGNVLIGPDCRIGPFVEIQDGVVIGASVSIGSHSFVCRGVTIKSRVFIGHGVMFTNAKHPVVANKLGSLPTKGAWLCGETIVWDGVVIGSGAVILPNITIGPGAVIGAGAVVTHNVQRGEVVVGNPSRVLS